MSVQSNKKGIFLQTTGQNSYESALLYTHFLSNSSLVSLVPTAAVNIRQQYKTRWERFESSGQTHPKASRPLHAHGQNRRRRRRRPLSARGGSQKFSRLRCTIFEMTPRIPESAKNRKNSEKHRPKLPFSRDFYRIFRGV